MNLVWKAPCAVGIRGSGVTQLTQVLSDGRESVVTLSTGSQLGEIAFLL